MSARIYFLTLIIFILGILFFWGGPINLPWLKKSNKTEPKIALNLSVILVSLLFLLIITILYSLFPGQYFITVPFYFFDHPMINAAGILVLKISLAWFVAVFSEFNVIKRSIIKGDSYTLEDYYESIYLTKVFWGISFLLFGFFLVLSSATTLLLLLVFLFFPSR